MRTDLFDYHLPPELIAQTPSPRGESRLLVLHKADGRIEHRRFPDLLAYLHSGDTLVINDTRVIARRLRGLRPSGKSAEILLLRPVGERQWEALVKPGRSLRPGSLLTLLKPPDSPGDNNTPEDQEQETARVLAHTPEGGRLLEFDSQNARDRVSGWGSSPLPPYIHAPLPTAAEERYQTVYALHNGSAAAPTAGLHFTEDLLTQAQAQGIRIARITLHVGVDTFRPVKTEDTAEHQMHGEWVTVSEEAARIINQTPGRIIAVGTTSVRALESAALQAASKTSATVPYPPDNPVPTAPLNTPIATLSGTSDETQMRAPRVVPFTGETRLFITPGYTFGAVDALITNFHLPRSTLLMLISALAGREAVLSAYAEAVREKYRFFSFGDAMLII